MEAHSLELLHLAIWIICILGTGGTALIVWGGKKVLARLDGIEELLASEVMALREMQHSMDVRLTRIEERCAIVHNHNIRSSPP